ncbi:hypothetical protein C8J56DRAFT_890898 [Mycena floridula]|nr:hypothetical protein C8J56DRAFT_890898 [Mycena floridula]
MPIESRGKKHPGRKPTKNEVENSIKDGEHKDVSKIAVRTMRCVGYDADFHRRIATESQGWADPPRKQKATSGKAKGVNEDEDDYIMTPMTKATWKTNQYIAHLARGRGPKSLRGVTNIHTSSGSSAEDPRAVERILYPYQFTRIEDSIESLFSGLPARIQNGLLGDEFMAQLVAVESHTPSPPPPPPSQPQNLKR